MLEQSIRSVNNTSIEVQRKYTLLKTMNRNSPSKIKFKSTHKL